MNKINGDFERVISVEQVPNGYIVSCPSEFCGHKKQVWLNFIDAVNNMAFLFGLTNVGESFIPKDHPGNK